MKKISYNVLAASVVAALGASNAMAVVDFTTSPAGSCVYANEIDVSTAGTNFTHCNGQNTEGLNFKYMAPNTAAVTGDNSYFVHISLSNGAKFGASGVGSLQCTGADTAGTVVSLDKALSGANASTAFFQYTVASGGNDIGIKANAHCTVQVPPTAGNTGVVLTQKNNVTVTVATKYLEAASFRTAIKQYTYLEFKKGMAAKAVPSSNAGVINVQSASKVLDGAASTTKLYAGYLSYADAGNSASLHNTAAVVAPTIINYINNGGWTVTVTGAPIEAATKVTLYKDKCSGTALASGSPASTGSQSVSLSIRTAQFAGTAHVCVDYDGQTAIKSGLITVNFFNRNSEGSYTLGSPSISVSPNQLYNLQKNGAVVEVDMMTPSSGLFRTFVRFTNPTNDSGKVYVKAYNDNGEAGANSFTFDLGPGQSKMYNAATIESGTGVAPLTDSNDADNGAMKANKVRLYVEAEFKTVGIQVMNVATDNNYFGQLTGARSK